MKFSDLKYLLSLSIPFISYFSINLDGIWSWATLIYAFVVVPSVETILNEETSNSNILDNEEERNKSYFFKFLLFINLPLIYFLIYLYFHRVSENMDTFNLIGKTLSIGVLLGANAINVAHELGHKNGLINSWSAKLLLLPCLYTYFTLQHNRGHHLNVGTPLDPATARYNETIYQFWWRCIPASFKQAFQLENERLKRSNISVWSISNEMIVNILLQTIYLVTIFYFWGLKVLMFAIFIGVLSILLLEAINYVEHYGLSRNLLPSGKYERVELMHSWNSNHVLGRMMLYELTRHADHHYKANKNYQMLLHYDESPQLPYGYPAAMLMSLIPPLWFKKINPVLLKYKTISSESC